jgi:hypothetical protein
MTTSGRPNDQSPNDKVILGPWLSDDEGLRRLEARYRYDIEWAVHQFKIGDVVRVGAGRVEWTITGKGATTGLTLKNEQGRTRYSQAFDVTLLRRAVD